MSRKSHGLKLSGFSVFGLLIFSAMFFVGSVYGQGEVSPVQPPPVAAVLADPGATGAVQMPTAPMVKRGTLDKIREYGAVYVGHRESSSPFSFLLGEDVAGYSWDLCGHIVEAIKLKLGNPALKAIPVPVTSASRLLMLMNGTIDLECGSTTNTKIRQQSVAFGVSTFVAAIKAVVRKDSGITDFQGLNGKMIVVTSGTTTERSVKTTLAQRNVTARFVTGRDHGDSFNMFESGVADSFVLDDALLSAFVVQSLNKEKYTILEDNFGLDPYGIGLRRNDPEFKKLVDDTLIATIQSGELEKLYNKWFMSPIPPKGINLEMPMNEVFKTLLQNPNDKGN